MDTTLTNKIRRGEIDINNQSLFFMILIKGIMQQLKKDITVRGVGVPHFILNTGDDTMWLGVKGQNAAIEPGQVSNEDYVYSVKPRCIVEPKGINLIPDQLTSPYSQGQFQLEHEEGITTFTAEFRRYPLTMTFDLNYYLDTYTDALELIQQIITKLSFIRTASIVYMGQHIKFSYSIPESMDTEYNMQIEGNTTDNKDRKINLQLTVETYMPVYDVRTVIQVNHYIRKLVNNINLDNTDIPRVAVDERDAAVELLQEMLAKYKEKDAKLASLLTSILAKINEKGLEDGFLT